MNTKLPPIELLSAMLDVIPDHVFLLEVLEAGRYRMVYSNEAMSRFMGIPQSCLQGMLLSDIITDPILYATIDARYREALSCGHTLRYEESTEGFSSAPLTLFDTRLAPLADGEGRLRYICGISRDITLRKQAEQALAQSNAELESTLAEVRILQQQLHEEAIRDPLTGLFNRRYFTESLERELHRAQREHFPVTLMMIDLDHFKQVNDQQGHQAGDRVLQAFSEYLLRNLRSEDVLCRWGGEEFIIMLPGLALEVADERIRQWHRAITALMDDCERGSGSLEISFSAGLAEFPRQAATLDSLLRAADQALYRAKREGRNRVCLYQPRSL